jgi:hypothetical protein
LTPVSFPRPGLPVRQEIDPPDRFLIFLTFAESDPVSRLSRTMSLTNLIETQRRRAASVCVLPCSTTLTARSRTSTGCDFPISDPHICFKRRESQKKALGIPNPIKADTL